MPPTQAVITPIIIAGKGGMPRLSDFAVPNTAYTAKPTASDLFGFNSYDGGAVVLHALRATIGDQRFFELLQTWVAQNSGTSRTTDEFIALAEQVSAMDLTEFFDTWLFAAVTPKSFPAAVGA